MIYNFTDEQMIIVACSCSSSALYHNWVAGILLPSPLLMIGCVTVAVFRRPDKNEFILAGELLESGVMCVAYLRTSLYIVMGRIMVNMTNITITCIMTRVQFSCSGNWWQLCGDSSLYF